MDTKEILDFSQTVPGYYDVDELHRLLQLVQSLPQDATIVEIGVEYGRSASIYLQCPEHWTTLHLIDNRSHNAQEGRDSTYSLIERFNLWDKVQIHEQDSGWVALAWWAMTPRDGIDLLHLDGDHEKGIWDDCELWLTKLKIGGILVAHDYKRKGADPTTGSVFPDVDAAIDQYTSGPEWETLGLVNTQIAKRKIA